MIITLDSVDEIRVFYSKVVSEVCSTLISEDNIKIEIKRAPSFRGQSGLSFVAIVDSHNESARGRHNDTKMEELTRKWAQRLDKKRGVPPYLLTDALESIEYRCDQWGLDENCVSIEAIFDLHGARATELAQKIIAAAVPKKIEHNHH